MFTVSDILEQLGGVAAVSNETGIPFTTVHTWKRAGFVPHWRVPTLVSLAKSRGKPIDTADIPVRGASSLDAEA